MPDWRHQAACRDQDRDLFFPAGKTGPYLKQIQRAKAVCQTCPVMQECRAWALDNREMHGIFGGMDETERQKLLRRTRRIAAPRSDRKWVQILRNRLPEYQALVAQGLSVSEIARGMETTVQTVNNVQRALEERALELAS
ncbi:WhiB family transcriptional regulator [Streptomyces hygroscopicus]|uniref:WhiB family transcriptional regulator n=1 Tax=Streptomyces hygroscopicus TaxID=1912 RepID=UPI0036B0244C